MLPVKAEKGKAALPLTDTMDLNYLAMSQYVNHFS
jgi:hypothetical protein